MVLWKTWIDLRTRALVGGAVLLLVALFKVLVFPHLGELLPYGAREVSERPLAWVFRDYRSYVDVSWFGSTAPDAFAMLAVVLSLGGVLGERRSRTLLLTLSLPASRRRWLITQALTGGGLLLVLALTTSLVVALAAALVGESYPIGRALANGLRLGLGSCAWVGLTLGLRSLSASLAMPVALLALGLVAMGLAAAFEPLRAWTVWGVLDPASWERAVPWPGLAVTLLLAAGGTALAAQRLERMDV